MSSPRQEAIRAILSADTTEEPSGPAPLRPAMARAEGRAGFAGLSSQARCRAVAEEIQGAADKRGIPLKLRRKK